MLINTYDIIIHDIETITNNNITEFQNLFVNYFRLKKKLSNKPYFILLLSTYKDFKYFNKYCLFEIIDFKKTYKNVETGKMWKYWRLWRRNVRLFIKR